MRIRSYRNLWLFNILFKQSKNVLLLGDGDLYYIHNTLNETLYDLSIINNLSILAFSQPYSTKSKEEEFLIKTIIPLFWFLFNSVFYI